LALARLPASGPALNLAGIVAGLGGEPAGAALWFRRLLAVEPSSEDGIVNLANATIQAQDWQQAYRLVRREISTLPSRSLAHYNLGVAAIRLGSYEIAVRHSSRAQTIDPSLADAVYNEALARLALGDWSRGFALYERRWDAPSFPVRWRPFPGRRWNGALAPTDHLLLLAEQGHGDTIQFARYIPHCRARVRRLTIVAPRILAALLGTIPGIDVIEEGKPLPEADLHAPLASLPFLFRTTPTTVPADIPYLRITPGAAQRVARLVAAPPPRIGICWKGNPSFVDDAWRSPGLQAMSPILSVLGVSFVSLVKDPGEDQISGRPITDVMSRMADFADTAALITDVNLVITSDTAVAHLAGALGRPVWLLISAAADWRWLTRRDDTPWYPSMVLFRQTTLGDWTEPVARVVHRLGAWRDRA